jgi:hypothetical protein
LTVSGVSTLNGNVILGDAVGDVITVNGTTTFVGPVNATTQQSQNNTTLVATTAFVKTAINDLIGGALPALDTLNELATALGNDANYATTITNSLSLKAPLASPDFTGEPTAPTASANQNDTAIATTAFVVGQAASATPLGDGTAAVGSSLRYARQDHVHPTDTSLAPKADPTFTGTVTVGASGIAFTDGAQTKQGVPSLTEIKPNITGNTTTTTLSSPLTYRDTLVAIAGAFSVTVDADSTNSILFPVGTTLSFYQSVGTGGASIVQGAGVTLLATPGLIFRDRYSSVSITKVAANTWLVFGDLKAS